MKAVGFPILLRRHNLEVPLMATKGWDIVREEWIIDTDIYNPETKQWGINDQGKSLEPTDWDLVKAFRGLLQVSESRDTRMVTVSITSVSPLAAQQWITKLVRDLNEHMREQEVSEAEASIQYLEGKLQETNIAGMQQVFYQLIESETRTIMLASAQREYVFRTIDPAVVPQEKSGPKRALICVVATMLGGMLGVFVVFVLAFVRSGKAESSEAVS